MLEVAGRRFETSGLWMLEVGRRKFETSELWMLEVGRSAAMGGFKDGRVQGCEVERWKMEDGRWKVENGFMDR
jgi:hypothetical protein